MRHFLTLAYNGARYCGWQIQPSAPSVQETLETALGTILREKIAVTGCGRTDTGVHARYYVAHFDTAIPLPERFLNSLNSLLPKDIALFSCRALHDEAHARFDAFERSYEYHLSFRKDPFGDGLVWFYPQGHKLQLEKLQETADLFPKYEAFFPFCKTNSGVDHYRCALSQAQWEWQPEHQKMIFHVSANRFLRGMVRLMVGACLQTAAGQLHPEQVQQALETQEALPKNLSVPPDGLYLTGVKYPYAV